MHYSLYALLIVSVFCLLLIFYVGNDGAIDMGSFSQIKYQNCHDQNEVSIITKWNGEPARLMSYKNYCILAFFLESAMSRTLDYYDRITLVLHMSYNYFDERIVDQVAGWDGPISMSVYLSVNSLMGQIDKIRKMIKKYQTQIALQLSIHLFFKADQNSSCFEKIHRPHLFNLSRTNANADRAGLYPINVARNIARMLSNSRYILLSDYEFIFSHNFEADMRKLAAKHLAENAKAVLVCRIFEALGNMSTVPRDKESLNEYYNNQTAIEFHARYAGQAHKIAGLDEWFAHKAINGQPSIHQAISYERYDWEPEFVSLTSIPFHDEEFPYPIRDNTVLRWEMCRMNYTFLVVHDHFMVHPGMKVSGNGILRENAMEQCNIALEKFKKRMDQHYPETKSKCPKISQ